MEKSKWIEEVLNSANELQRAEAGPFFFEKLSGRIEHSKTGETAGFRGMWVLRVSLAAVIVINVFFITSRFSVHREKSFENRDAYAELGKELGYQSSYNY